MMLREPIGLPQAPRRSRVSPWTKQRTRVLRQRWSQGARVREIAGYLGRGTPHNAVMGNFPPPGFSARPPSGGAPGRPYTPTTRPADGPVPAQRTAWWFRKGPLPAWVVNAKPYV